MIHQAHYFEMNQRDSIVRQPFDKIQIVVLNNNLIANYIKFGVVLMLKVKMKNKKIVKSCEKQEVQKLKNVKR